MDDIFCTRPTKQEGREDGKKSDKRAAKKIEANPFGLQCWASSIEIQLAALSYRRLPATVSLPQSSRQLKMRRAYNTVEALYFTL